MLRPYQIDAIDQIRNCMKSGVKRVLLHMATGAGKSVVLFDIVQKLYKNDKRVIMVVRGRHLVNQLHKRLQSEGIPHGVLMAGHWAMNLKARIQVCSIDTVISRKHFFDDVHMIVVDEVHQATSKGYKKFIDQYPSAYVLGVTATPYNEKSLRHVADTIVQPITMSDLIDQKYLCPPIYYAPMQLDLSGVKISKSTKDFVTADLDSVLNNNAIIGDIVSKWKSLGENRQTLVFAASVSHSKHIAQIFNGQGIPTAHCDADTPEMERAATIESFERGELRVLTNVGLWGTGVDIPCISCIVMARPTMSYMLYIQQCLDSQTEILTKQGFKGIDYVKKNDIIAGFDNGKISWVKVDNKIKRPMQDGEKFIEYDSPHLNFRVTDGHEMIFRAGRDHKTGDWKKILAGDLAKRKSEFSVPSAGILKTKGLGLSKEELIFLGLWIADGTMGKTGQISISQARHQTWFEDLKKLFKKCGFRWKEYIFNGHTKYKTTSEIVRFNFLRGRVKNNKNGGGVRDPKGISRLDKYFDKNIGKVFNEITKKELGFLLEGLHIGDGTKYINEKWTRRSYHITTGRKRAAENLQVLCVTRGYQANLATHNNKKWKNELYQVHIKDLQQRHVGGIGYKDRPTIKTTDPKKQETVWCVTNKLASIVTRRKGKVVIMGNCGRGTRTYPGKENFVVLDNAGNVLRHGLITENRAGNIDGDLEKPKVIPVKTCEKCFFVYSQFQTQCPGCGHANEKKSQARTPLEVEGQLVKFDDLSPVDKAKIDLKRFKKIKRQNKFKRGWVWHQIKNIYGEEIATQLCPPIKVPYWILKNGNKSF